MRHGKVWYFTVIYFCLQVAVYGVAFYLPQQVASLTGHKVGLAVRLLVAVPWFFGIVACYVVGRAATTVRRRRVLGVVLVLGGIYALGALPFLAALMTSATRWFENRADDLL